MISPLLFVPARLHPSKAYPQINAQVGYGSFMSHTKQTLHDLWV